MVWINIDTKFEVNRVNSMMKKNINFSFIQKMPSGVSGTRSESSPINDLQQQFINHPLNHLFPILKLINQAC